MGLLANLLWGCEFILELAGAVLVFRHFRTIKLFWGYLAFRAAADAATFLLKINSDPSDLWATWRWFNYWQLMVQYVVLAVLAMLCIGAAVNADKQTVRRYGSLAGVLGIAAIAIAHGGPWTAFSLLRVGARADWVLAVLVAGALLLRECDLIVAPMKEPWGWICAGFLVAVTTDGAVSELLAKGQISGVLASRLMACGQVLALAVWIFAAMQRENREVVRASLGHSVELPQPLVQDDSVHLWN